MVIRMVIVLLSLTAATGYPADLLLERVLSHKHQLQLRPLTSRQIYSVSLLGLQRLSRQLKDVTTPPADGSESGRQVRLVGGPGPWEGAVEVHTAFGWHRVIATRWSEVEASVVCRQLGHVSFFRAAPLPYASLLSLDGTDDTPVNIHKCSGREASLLDCDQAAVEAPAPPVGVSCLSAEDLSERCGEGELPFGDSCYFVGRESVTRLKAELYCRQRNASLVVVNSQLKNDFLSGAISSMGLEGFHTAGRSHRIGKTETIWSWESSDAPFLFTKWNPDELSTEPLGVEQRCLTLEPSEAASVAELDYAFWASSDCSRRLQYVCETPRDWTDCARDVAGSYAGTVSTAESGRPCLPWSDVAGVSGLSSAALVANLCRNPDGDRGPWCFTGPDQFEYCNIAACPPHLPPPPSPKEDNYTCHSLQFACGNGRCTKVTYVCDGDRDCADGRDETVCSALPASFQTFDLMQVTFPASIRLIEAITSDSDISVRTCQFLCLADPSCYAVQYDILKKRCYRIVRPLGEFRVTRDPLSSVHVVLSRYRPCSGHRCDDFQCLNRTGVRCDGVRDCLDVSDELDCAAEAPVPLRLVDGAVAGSGRLEARFQGRWGAVCDDGFNSRSADVACRQLGFNRHRRMFLNGRGYPAAAGAAYYAISFSACDGNEEQLADCILQSDENRCTDGEQVSLECTNETGICTLLPNFFECLDSSACVAPSQLCDGQRKCSDGSDESEDVCQGQKVRLVGDSQPPRVQVKPAGSVRPFLAVISRAFGEHEANFLCRSLGGGSYGVPVEDVRLLPEDEIVADVLCSSAANCSAQTTAPGPEARAVRLRCLTEKPPPPLLRLVGGNERSGLLELRPPLADWGRVCAATFNAAQAKVVCHQLGFSGESGFLETTRNLNITVSLRAMDCLGDENNIKECFRQPWANVTGPEVCGGSGEVYLSCDDPGKPSAPAAPLTPQCAADAADVDRVLGGRTAASGDLPAFARLQIFSGSAWKLRCGATVLSERFLLTAAHCVKPSTSDRLRGVDELPVSRLSMLVGGGQRAAVRRVIPHPGHGILSPHSDDLALVELERSLDFSADVQPACLPPQDTSYSPGLVCSVAGYGSTRPQRGPSATADASSALASDTLQVGNVTFFTRDECQGFYGRRNITLGMVCAGDERFEVDTCDGDSGGPLLCRLGDASVLMGVTSWGPGCGRPQQPGVYVRVASYVSWIRAVMQGAPAA